MERAQTLTLRGSLALTRVAYPKCNHLPVHFFSSIFILYFHVSYCRQLTEKELPDSYVLFQDAFNRSRKMSDGKTFVALQININRVFTDEQEKHIEEYAIKIARMLYGLPVPEFRKLVYYYAEACGSKAIPEIWKTTGRATRDWYYAYIARHPNLAL